MEALGDSFDWLVAWSVITGALLVMSDYFPGLAIGIALALTLALLSRMYFGHSPRG